MIYNKDNYKELKNHKNVIYLYTNKINGKQYVGQTIRPYVRYKDHWDLKDVSTSVLEQSIKKHGIDNFDFEILEEYSDLSKEDAIKKLNKREIYFIKQYDTYRYGYNQTEGGEFNPMFYKEHRDKLKGSNNGMNQPGVREKHKKACNAPDRLAKLSKASIGKNNPMYGKKNTNHPAYGHRHTEETKQRLREINTGEGNPMYGTKHTEDHKQKISDSVAKTKNSTGIKFVSKQKSKRYKLGYFFRYGINKKKSISAPSLDKLHDKVVKKDLEWTILNINKAKEYGYTLEE